MTLALSDQVMLTKAPGEKMGIPLKTNIGKQGGDKECFLKEEDTAAVEDKKAQRVKDAVREHKVLMEASFCVYTASCGLNFGVMSSWNETLKQVSGVTHGKCHRYFRYCGNGSGEKPNVYDVDG
ncbi:hypothetical protein CEXT_129951 [Caerostris extrusa]|uniref:Uncharacterized protein n=1 Tax=Caerostris extrusa TaxID=172846 RepID=A0AAV4QAL5_CAEEX|nr:hypothetical protein CEXT_129951 [Caerostris extrusa]